MPKAQISNIRFESIKLLSLKFKENPDFNQSGKQINVNFDIGISNKLIKEKKLCLVNQKIVLFREEEIAPFTLNVEMQGFFSVDNEKSIKDLEGFCKTNAHAVMFPYARNIISSITSETAYPTLHLPLINVARTFETKK